MKVSINVGVDVKGIGIVQFEKVLDMPVLPPIGSTLWLLFKNQEGMTPCAVREIDYFEKDGYVITTLVIGNFKTAEI